MKLFAPLAWVAVGMVLTTGTAYAATNGTFILGRSNTAAGTTTLTATHGTPLSLHGDATSPPLAVGGNTTRVASLNSDLLDGLDAGAFQHVIHAGCPGGAVQTVAANGTVACVPLPTQWVAVVGADGSLDSGSTGVTSGRYLNAVGSFFVQVPGDASACAWTATSAGGKATSASVSPINGQPSYVGVQTASGSAAAYEPFHLLVTCP